MQQHCITKKRNFDVIMRQLKIERVSIFFPFGMVRTVKTSLKQRKENKI